LDVLILCKSLNEWRPFSSKATTSPWFDEWRLTTDPWVFVVDASGNVAAKFDGPTAPGEIDPALAAVAPR